MPEPSEDALIMKLFQKTQQNQVDWHATGLYGQLAASFAGKYTVLLTYTALGTVEITVKNASGDNLSNLTNHQSPQLKTLHELAKQYARRVVDDQLNEILKELDKP